MSKCKFLLVLALGLNHVDCPAQLLNRIKSKVEQKVVEKIDQSIDKASQKKSERNSGAADQPQEQPAAAPEHQNSTASQQSQVPVHEKPLAADIRSYSKFDFVPGNEIVLHEDFSTDEIGDFPATWNTRSTGEVVTIDGRQGNWLRIAEDGAFYPESLGSNLPDNFTLQFDLIANKQVANIGQMQVTFMQADDTRKKFELGQADRLTEPNFKICFQPNASKGEMRYSSHVIGAQNRYGVPEFNSEKGSVKVSVWRQPQRVRVYLDSTKILDLPRALNADDKLNSLVFASKHADFGRSGGAFFVGNIQLALGAADTRNKFLNEGKFVSHGIRFDVNSDNIRPESYGSLNEMAKVLRENGTLRVKVVGHTDADGNDEANLDLARRRAASVKSALISVFGIDASRLESDGKGESEPLDSNDTPVGKAKNRRVEFLKI